MDERELPTALPDLFREAMARLADAEAELDRQIAAERAEHDEARAKLAERARSGGLGADWQQVQRRVDRGETTLESVFSGADESEPAKALRAQSQANLRSLSEQLQEDDDEEDGEPKPAAVVSAAAAESSARFEAASARIAEALRGVDRGRAGK